MTRRPFNCPTAHLEHPLNSVADGRMFFCRFTLYCKVSSHNAVHRRRMMGQSFAVVVASCHRSWGRMPQPCW